MFQDPLASLSPRLTVQKPDHRAVQDPRPRRRDLAGEARRLLAMVGLDPSFASRFRTSSPAVRRAASGSPARALSPKVVIADEPTAGLDVSVQGGILNLMNRLQRDQGLSYVVITHNLPVVRRHVSDRLAIMYMGRFVEQGPRARSSPGRRTPHRGALDRDAHTRSGPAPAAARAQGRGAEPAQSTLGLRVPHPLPLRAKRCRIERPLPQLRPPGQTVRCPLPAGVIRPWSGLCPARLDGWSEPVSRDNQKRSLYLRFRQLELGEADVPSGSRPGTMWSR